MNKNFTTVFSDNLSGRRILSDRSLQDAVDTNTYRGNEAAYAPDLASIAASYKYKFIQNGVELGGDNPDDEVIFAPGQDI